MKIAQEITEQDGKVTFDFAATEASEDWIHAGRLKAAAKAGDKKAKKEYDRMNNTKQVIL